MSNHCCAPKTNNYTLIKKKRCDNLKKKSLFKEYNEFKTYVECLVLDVNWKQKGLSTSE